MTGDLITDETLPVRRCEIKSYVIRAGCMTDGQQRGLNQG
jgi:hypothetical protein